MNAKSVCITVLLGVLALGGVPQDRLTVDSVDAPGDWPMWRYDHRRSASSPHTLPQNLTLRWVRELPPSRPAWPPTQGKLQFDVAPQPVAMGKRLFVPSNATDSVTAFDTETGNEVWRFYAEGPVRFAPIAHAGKVYLASDDGHLYCLDAATGALKWKVNGGPADRRIIGNHRLVSSWPARGGPVLADGRIYFAASIWPFMGIFIHAVDAESGRTIWTNSGTGTNYTIQPHSAPSFASVVPQGHLVVAKDRLIVPGGRSTPAVYDVKTGELQYFFFDKRNGSHEVFASLDSYYLPKGSYHVESGSSVSEDRPSVLDAKFLLSVDGDEIEIKSGVAKVTTRETKDRRGNTRTVAQVSRKTFGTFDTHGGNVRAHLRAGKHVYISDDEQLAAFDLQSPAAPTWKGKIDGRIWTMLAADKKLFAVTTDGKLFCFGEGSGAAKRHPLTPRPGMAKDDAWSAKARDILSAPDTGVGFGLVLGLGSGRLAEELVRRSQIHLVAIDPDARKVDAFRRKMQSEGLYGSRVSAIVGDAGSVGLPKYFANLIASEDPSPAKVGANADKVFDALRPYGGTAFLPVADVSIKDPQAKISRKGTMTKVVRAGALPQTDDWSHNYANGGQTGISKEALVKAPLGILWFGGASHEKILPRHGHGPSPQVAGGRLFIEGPDMLRCVDVYTGRVWWEKTLQDFGKYYNITAHFPGAGEIGSNYVSLEDSVYCVYGNAILELNARTGELVKEFKLKVEAGKEPPNWGYIGVWGDYLVTTSSPVPVQSSSRSSSRSTRSKLPSGLTEILRKNSEWKYLAGKDPATGWTGAAFDDGSWKTGRAGFGYGDNDDKTTLRDMQGNYRRVYIRKTFDLKSVPAEVGLAINYDDSFIAYINGKEVIRQGVKRGSGASAKDVSSHEADGYEYFSIKNAGSILKAGKNVIALEGHNTSPTSSDFSLDPYLVGKGKASAVAKKETPTRKQDPEANLPKGRYASGSRRLVVFDRRSGRLLWQRDASFNFRHNNIAIGGGKVFCIDSMTDQKLQALARRGLRLLGKPALYALDLKTGKIAWSTEENVFGTFVNYSDDHDILIQGGSRNRDRARDEQGKGLSAYRGKDGKVLWESDRGYSGPVLMWKDKLITNGNSGVALEIKTGEERDLKFRRMYGCNYVIGSQHMLTFRSGAAGFFDLLNESGTGNFGGFKSSCTPNLIPANGVLNAPDYTRTCSCAYQNQTSLALVHMPEAEFWAFGGAVRKGQTGLNFGAPGDRRAPNGTLWLDVPSVGGPSEKIEVAISPEKPEIFRVHSSAVVAGEPKWVAASGVKGVKRIEIKVDGSEPRRLRLHFMEPEDAAAGKRVFDVSIQGRKVLQGFDVAKEASGSRRGLVRDFTATPRDGRIVIEFEPKAGLPALISGVEILVRK